MRTYTLALSILAHALAVGALIVSPALATHELPEPRRTTAYVIVRPDLPAPAVRPRTRPATAVPAHTVAALTPPDEIRPEPSAGPVDSTPFDLGGDLVVGPVGDVVRSGELVPPPPPPAPAPRAPVRVGGRIQAPARLVHVDPVYPPLAIASRKEGLVILEALIDDDGTIRDVRTLRAEPLFEQAAIAAVRQWRFSPTLLNGEPVPIVMTVTVGFRLTR